jgi:RNA polymerase sigma-70 factor (ECF subfamily)
MVILTNSNELNIEENQNEIEQEAELIAAAQEDIQYFEPLYNKYYEAIFRFIYRKTEDEDIAADITSHVFMNAIKALPKYEVRSVLFGAWLYRIAHNETNKHFRNQKKKLLSLEDHKVNLVMSCDELEDGEEKLAVLHKLIAELNDGEVRILELKFFENKNFKEIAFILDKKESAIKMRLYRSLNKLKKRYQQLNK